jgi:hypothetical protein
MPVNAGDPLGEFTWKGLKTDQERAYSKDVDLIIQQKIQKLHGHVLWLRYAPSMDVVKDGRRIGRTRELYALIKSEHRRQYYSRVFNRTSIEVVDRLVAADAETISGSQIRLSRDPLLSDLGDYPRTKHRRPQASAAVLFHEMGHIAGRYDGVEPLFDADVAMAARDHHFPQYLAYLQFQDDMDFQGDPYYAKWEGDNRRFSAADRMFRWEKAIYVDPSTTGKGGRVSLNEVRFTPPLDWIDLAAPLSDAQPEEQ